MKAAGLSPLSRRAREKGFTLLEVLVAVAIFSIVLAALYSAFFVSRRAVDAVDNSLVRLQEARAVTDGMKRELEAMLWRERGSGAQGRLAVTIEDRDIYGKQASRLVFTSLNTPIPGAARITYEVEEVNKRLVLRKKMEPAFITVKDAKSFEIIEDIEAFAVEVWLDGKWTRTWDTGLTKRRPEELRITLALATKSREDLAPGEKQPFVVTVTEIAKPRMSQGS